MANFKSNFTGAQIDSGIAKAISSIQPEDLQDFQERLISGTNIKTINSQTLLGRGDLLIQGGLKTKTISGTDIDEDDISTEDLRDIINNDYDAVEFVAEDDKDNSLVSFLLVLQRETREGIDVSKEFCAISAKEEEVIGFRVRYEDKKDYRCNFYSVELNGGDQSIIKDIYPYSSEINLENNIFTLGIDLNYINDICDNDYPFVAFSNGSYKYIFTLMNTNYDSSKRVNYQCLLSENGKILSMTFQRDRYDVDTYMGSLGGGSSTTGWTVKEIDASNSSEWDSKENRPTQETLDNIVANKYQAIHIYNLGAEYSMNYEIYMSVIQITDSDNGNLRQYLRFEYDDENKEDSVLQIFNFYTKFSGASAQMEEEDFSLGGGSTPVDAPIYFETTSCWDGENVVLDIINISNAIDNNKEVVIKINFPGQESQYFRIINHSENKEYFSYHGDSYWVPTFVSYRKDGKQYIAQYDSMNHGEFNYKIYTGYEKFTPQIIDLANNQIAFDVDDYTYIYNRQLKNLEVNLGENGNIYWVNFTQASHELDPETDEDAINYISEIIPVHYNNQVGLKTYTLRLRYNGGNLESAIFTDYLAIGSAPAPITYAITNSLQGVITSNPAETVEKGSTYQTVLSTESGYNWLSAQVMIDGVNKTNETFDRSSKSIFIPNVTKPISIEGLATTDSVYSITTDFTNCYMPSDSGILGVRPNEYYSAQILPTPHHEMTPIYITMNGEDISSTAWDGERVTISQVTGDVSIVASALARSYNVNYNLGTGVSLETNPIGMPGSLNYGDSFSGTFSIDSGYETDSVSIYMGSQDITNDVLSGNSFYINFILEEITITINTREVPSGYSMNYSLDKHTSLSYMPDTVNEGDSYYAQVSFDSGYQLDKIHISNDKDGDVTSQYFDWGSYTINIPSVYNNYTISISSYYK